MPNSQLATLKQLKLVFIFFLLLFFYGCTQEKEFVNDQNHSKLKIENKTFQEVLNIPIFNESYQRLAHKKGKTINTQEARTALEDEFNFTIVENSPVKVLTDEVSTSYVLLIERTVEENLKFENLIINIKEDEMIASIMKYTLSEKATYLELHEAYDMDVIDVEISILANDSKESCTSVFIPYCNNTTGGQPAGHFAFSDGCSISGYYEYTSCSEGGGGGGFDGSSGNNGGNPPTGSGNTGGGGGGNVDGVSNPPINTTPIVNQSNITILPSKKFIKNLTTISSPNYNPERAACYLNSSSNFKAALASFIDNNGPEITEEGDVSTSEQFANAAIDAKCNGGEVDFDNGIILDSSFLLNAKAICIYNKLKTSSTFQHIFANVFEESYKPFIILKAENLSGNADSGTVGNCIPTNGNAMLNTIKIDTDLISDGHPLQIAKTIAHEFIHAFLNIKLSNSGLGMSIPAISNLDFIQAVNTYYNGFSDGQDQHNFIYNFMIPTLQSILAEIKDLCVTPTNNANMLGLSMYIPLNTSPSKPFVWNEYFKNLALAGLQDCNFFHSEIGTLNSSGVPIITVDQTKMQSFNQYNQRGRENLLKNCN